MKKLFLLSMLVFFVITFTNAQNVGINTDATPPDPSAMLDVKNANKGLLVPRVNLTSLSDGLTIPSPAKSLLVYNINIPNTTLGEGYFYNSGTAATPVWLKLATGAGSGGTGWLLTGNAGTVDGTNFIGTTDNVPFNVRVNNQKAGRIDNTLGNTFWGYQAGNANTTGYINTASGYQALLSNTTGYSNTANGVLALYTNTTGYSNTSNGYKALFSNITGSDNTANGVSALQNNTTGSENTANGVNALKLNTAGFYNTANGANALSSNTTGYSNTANGYNTLLSNETGTQNTANGANALNRNTSGYSNTANGSDALQYNTAGYSNTANGVTALFNNTDGNSNTANGAGTLFTNTTGSVNTANGVSALSLNSTGYFNTATGGNALYSNTTGFFNTANGNNALYSNKTGRDNTANGYRALYSNTTGSSNTGFGQFALFSNETGSNNTAIGNGANVSSIALNNATAIGNGAIVNADNKIRFGNGLVTVIEGQVAYSFPSDKRFKYDIKDNVPGLEFIKKLQPVTYYFDEKKLDEYTKTGAINNNLIHPVSYSGEKQLHTGFLAQDVEKIADELGYSFDGVHAPSNDKDHYSLAYSQFIMPLVKGMQEQQKIIETQQSDIDILKAEVAELIKAVKALTPKQ